MVQVDSHKSDPVGQSGDIYVRGGDRLQGPHDGVKIISKLKKQADCVPEPRARKPSIDEGQCRDGGIGQVSALGGTPETPQRGNTCETHHCH